MDQPMIRVQNISKEYRIGGSKEKYYTLRDTISHAITTPFRRVGNIWQGGTHSGAQNFWALRDVSFDVAQGEIVGIIGRNGAGKSTLLKILSRITDPTAGHIELHGRVASLLEVGTGFHPELTGRENIFLSGAVLGMTRPEIKRKFDEIVTFAEIEKFLDTPVKRYSSGMHMRLAFAVAAYLDPEILVVDEVLAVGDAAFQKKCLGKMDDVARGGRTVLFVSHQLEFLRQLCQRCLLLEKGKIVADGASDDIIDQYVKQVRQVQSVNLHNRVDRQGQGRLRFTQTWIENDRGERTNNLESGRSMKIVANYEIAPGEDVRDISFSFAVNTIRNVEVTNLNTLAINGNTFYKKIPSRGRIECVIPRLPLNSGDFFYNLLASSSGGGEDLEDWIKQAGTFSVQPGDFYGTGHLTGQQSLMVMPHQWHILTEEAIVQH